MKTGLFELFFKVAELRNKKADKTVLIFGVKLDDYLCKLIIKSWVVVGVVYKYYVSIIFYVYVFFSVGFAINCIHFITLI